MRRLSRWFLGLGFVSALGGVVACGSTEDAESASTGGDLESRLAAEAKREP